MRSPVAVYERREKSRSWHRDAMAAYKGRRPEGGAGQSGAGGKDKPATSLSGVDAWRQFISCPSPGGPGDLSF
ncbi:hypothetical protein B8F96_28310 (plasmid) [Klebsiella pneumoniae]|nr:hypothetical protein B8F96_28310 [Klebsiella pneumoniae]